MKYAYAILNKILLQCYFINRQKELQMYAMLKEIAICMVFLYIVLTIAYANRDPWSFTQFQNYENILNAGTFASAIGNNTVKFVDVSMR